MQVAPAKSAEVEVTGHSETVMSMPCYRRGHRDADCLIPWDFATETVTVSMMLHAGWRKTTTPVTIWGLWVISQVLSRQGKANKSPFISKFSFAKTATRFGRRVAPILDMPPWAITTAAVTTVKASVPSTHTLGRQARLLPPRMPQIKKADTQAYVGYPFFCKGY